MKLFWIVFVLAIGIFTGFVTATPVREGSTARRVNLKHVLDRFLALIDVDEFRAFILLKLASDPEAQGVLAYLKGPEAEAIVDHLWKDNGYVTLIKWLYENGLTNIYNDINELHLYFGWAPVTEVLKRIKSADPISAKSLGSLLEEILEQLPVDLLISLALELVEMEDAAVLALIQRFREPSLAESWEAFKSLPETNKLFNELQEGGIDIRTLIAMVEGYFGWGKINIYSLSLPGF